MKHILFLIAALLTAVHASGQGPDPEDSLLIRDIIKPQTYDPFIYTQTAIGTEAIIEAIIRRKQQTDTAQPVPRRQIVLAGSEYAYLRRRLKAIAAYQWPDALFPNSMTIHADSIFACLSREHQKRRKKSLQQQEGRQQAREVWVCSFSKPVYLRQGTLALFSALRLCGNSCGSLTIAYCRKQHGHWVIADVIGGGDF